MDGENVRQDETNVWRVVRVVPENQGINSLYLEGSDKKFAGRKAGQFVSIRIMGPEGWSGPHPFTLSGAPEDPFLRLTIKREGNFTSTIPNLKPGDPVKCMGPLGLFCRDIDAQPVIVMMAGGVGVTPFLSVLRHFRNIKAANTVTLFWVNKTIEDAFASQEISEMTGELNLTVVHCLTREEDVERYFQRQYNRILYEKGRLSAEILTGRGVARDAAFYLCGPPPMMEATRKELASLGVDPSSVRQEDFAWPGSTTKAS